ncbi:MAG: hypothetical protein VX217_03250, partial [Acidobacteriota bacterium]|nr:hypothetical protein [Acidobacteriota bacterium]
MSRETVYTLQGRDSHADFHTFTGVIQGDVLSSLLACLAVLPVQRRLATIIQTRYPFLKVRGAEGSASLSDPDKQLLLEAPFPEDATVRASLNGQPELSQDQVSSVHVSLRAYIDDQTLRCPPCLECVVDFLIDCLFAPVGIVFVPEKEESWDSARLPEGGVITVGIPLWGFGEGKLEHGVGAAEFLRQRCLGSVIEKHKRCLSSLRQVIENAPRGRPVGDCVERVLRMCVVARTTHIARAYPPSVTKPILAQCDQATTEFAAKDLYGWTPELFWDEAHAESVACELQLPLREGGTGLIANSEVADAAYVSSFLEPAPVIAGLLGESVPVLLGRWQGEQGAAGFHELRAALARLNRPTGNDLVKLHDEFSRAKAEHLAKHARKTKGSPVGTQEETEEPPFRWQQFLMRGYWTEQAGALLSRVQSSGWPFAEDAARRIQERRNPFARRIYNITPWEPRLQLDLAHFRASRSYFLGVAQRSLETSKKHPGRSLASAYNCYITNMHGKQCTGTVDAWGHGAFTCRHSSRHTEHNAVRNVIQSGSRSIGFLSGKEIWVPEWQHRIDVQNIDLEEDGDLPTSIDVTIRALCGTKGRQHANPADVHAAAEKSKCKEHPVRDAHGRHVVAGQFVPFSMTTMGGIGPEAAKFLKRCAVRNPDRTE